MKMYFLLVGCMYSTSIACAHEPRSATPTGETLPAATPPIETRATQTEVNSQALLPDTVREVVSPLRKMRNTESNQLPISEKNASSAEWMADAKSPASPQLQPGTPLVDEPRALSSNDSSSPPPQKGMVAADEESSPATPTPPSHAIWDQLLRKYVDAKGWVNYTALKKEQSRLEQYLELLANNPPQPTWNQAETMAFWINAYNAFTIKLILDHHPVSSITKIHSGQPWKVRWIRIGSKSYTLDEIENNILRPQFKDPRIHFALNCAARSCPPLLNQAWTADNLEANFERQARSFINNPSFNKITPTSIQVSKIFEWYAQDFGDLIIFLNRYSAVKIKPSARISYLEYDWGLNGS